MPFNLGMGDQSSGDHERQRNPDVDDQVEEDTHGQIERQGQPQTYIVFPSSTPVPLFHLPVAVRATVIRIANLQAGGPSNPHDIATNRTFDDWNIRDEEEEEEQERFDAWDIDAEECPISVLQCRLPVASPAA